MFPIGLTKQDSKKLEHLSKSNLFFSLFLFLYLIIRLYLFTAVAGLMYTLQKRRKDKNVSISKRFLQCYR